MMTSFDHTQVEEMQTILFTGGGSAGHVTPNIALIHKFQAMGWQVVYVGSDTGTEQAILGGLKIKYYGIKTGKLRRYFSWRTFLEPFAILYGIIQAIGICIKTKPNIVFSKGGFVAFPVVVAAWLNRIPIIIHESDLTPGLANKLSFPFANKICVTFAEGKINLASNKTVVTGTPIRESLLQGQSERGRQFCQFNDEPILLVLGGGQGSAIINDAIRSLLPKLLDHFQVAHVCGKGKIASAQDNARYRQFEYLHEELADIFACSDLVISRSGANSLYELLCLCKPHILVPLSMRASRGDQIVNAAYFADRGLSNVLYEEDLNTESLLGLINKVYADKDAQKKRLQDFSLPDSNQIIYQELVTLARK
jgi:UDP-N-acetylglucosamine--N-acetylmuramyl-(pentapeptide) pyrophosphoryl-undecaprenol N-acetylglucosamine transferase